MEKEVNKDAAPSISINKKNFEELKRTYSSNNLKKEIGIVRDSDADLLAKTLEIFPKIKKMYIFDNPTPLSLFENIHKIFCEIQCLQIANIQAKDYSIRSEYLEDLAALMTSSILSLRMDIMRGMNAEHFEIFSKGISQSKTLAELSLYNIRSCAPEGVVHIAKSLKSNTAHSINDGRM